MDLKAVQKPLKEHYRQDPASSRSTLRAQGAPAGTPMACSVDIGRAIYAAEAHRGVGETGTAACSGDLLLGALAVCAQITCQLVATALGIEFEKIEAVAEGDLDLRGTLGVSKEVPVGFESIRVRLDVSAPGITEDRLRVLAEKTEQYCVVLQTLTSPPPIRVEWIPGS
jgi:uncharacterized OsmC-like protein